MKVVPRRFIHLVASLEQVLDLKTVGFDDVVGRLKAYEERIRGEDGGDEHQQRVMFTRSNSGGRSNGGGGSGSGGGSTGAYGSQRGVGGGNRVEESSSNLGRNANPDGLSEKEFGSGGASGSGGFGSNGSGSGNGSWSKNKSNSFKNKPKNISDSNRNPKKDLPKVICYRCDKLGH